MELTCAKTESDLREIADLMAKVFTRMSYFDFYQGRMDYQTKDPYYKPEHSRIIKEEGRIVSHVCIIEKYLRIGSGLVKIGGIGDVLTHPDCRGKSYAPTLMRDAIQYMREQDYPLSMLYGIPNYYHKFGYIEAMGIYSAFVPCRLLSKRECKHTFRAAQSEDTPRLNELYNQAYARKTGSMKRVEAHWYRILNPKTTTVLLDATGAIQGYAISSKPNVPEYYVHEAAVSDAAAAESLLAHHGAIAHERFQSELELRMAPDHFLMQFAETLGGRFVVTRRAEGEGNAMLRTVNLFRALECIKDELEDRLRKSSLAEAQTGLNLVTDDAGEAALLIQKGTLSLSPKMDAQYPTLEIPQNLLTRSLIGYWDVQQLMMRSGLQLDAEIVRLLQVLFPKDDPFTCEGDYF